MLSLCAVPQTWTCLKTGKADGLSSGFLWLWFLGEIFTLAFVTAQAEVAWPLVANYSSNIILLLIILKFKYFPSKDV